MGQHGAACAAAAAGTLPCCSSCRASAEPASHTSKAMRMVALRCSTSTSSTLSCSAGQGRMDVGEGATRGGGARSGRGPSDRRCGVTTAPAAAHHAYAGPPPQSRAGMLGHAGHPPVQSIKLEGCWVNERGRRSLPPPAQVAFLDWDKCVGSGPGRWCRKAWDYGGRLISSQVGLTLPATALPPTLCADTSCDDKKVHLRGRCRSFARAE